MNGDIYCKIWNNDNLEHEPLRWVRPRRFHLPSILTSSLLTEIWPDIPPHWETSLVHFSILHNTETTTPGSLNRTRARSKNDLADDPELLPALRHSSRLEAAAQRSERRRGSCLPGEGVAPFHRACKNAILAVGGSTILPLKPERGSGIDGKTSTMR